MTKTVPAHLCMGWSVPNGSTYMTDWTYEERLEFKHRVTETLRRDIPDSWQLRWGGGAVTIEVEDNGSTPEINVQKVIERELASHNQDPDRQLDLALASEGALKPMEVYYVIINGQRVCVHNYGLQRSNVKGGEAMDPWTVGEFAGTPKAFETVIFMQLSWATPTP